MKKIIILTILLFFVISLIFLLFSRNIKKDENIIINQKSQWELWESVPWT